MSAVVLPLAALGMLVTKQGQIGHKIVAKQRGMKEKENWELVSAVTLPLAALGMLVTKQGQIIYKTAAQNKERRNKLGTGFCSSTPACS